jgi:hypothetical protein
MSRTRLRLTIYASGSTPLAYELTRNAEHVRLSYQYPGGLCKSLSFFIPYDLRRQWPVKEGQRVVVCNKFKRVWEGYIRQCAPTESAGRSGYSVTALGPWGQYLVGRRWRKPWADDRLEAWQYDETRNASNKCNFDQRNRLRFTPKNETWGFSHDARLTYLAPTGETVKRATGNYAVSEQAEVSPDTVVSYSGAAYADQADVCDGAPTTADGITLLAAGYLYIGKRELDCFSYLRFDLGPTFNSNAATLTAEYSAGIDDAGTTTWTALAITDGTAVAGKPFAQDGTITYTKPPAWGEGKVDGSTMYWLRLKTSANLTAATFNEIYTGETEAWSLDLYDLEFDDHPINVTTTGSGTFDFTLATPSNGLHLYFSARAKQTPPSNGTVYGEISNVVVYTETGTITARSVALNIAAYVSEMSSDTSNIGAPGVDLSPSFYADPAKPLSDILAAAASYGGASYAAWAPYILVANEYGDDKPRLALSAQPTTGATYYLRRGDANLAGNYQITRDVDSVFNYYQASYRDSEGVTQHVTPADDASFKDDASIALYGRRDNAVSLNTTSPALIAQYTRALLNRSKTMAYKVVGTINVQGYIRGAGGAQIPAAEIMPGQRLQFDDYLTNDGTPLQQLVTGVDYNADTDTATLTVGVSDSLDVWVSRKLKALAK